VGANSIRNGVASAALREGHSKHFDANAKSARIDLAVVGYGNWGSKHVRVLAGMPDVAVTVVDRDPLRLAAAGRAFPMVSLDESLDRVLPAVDGVIVATPPGSHASIAHAAMRADCHVLVEKPLATTVADCESLIDAAVMNDVHLMVGHTFEHDAAIWKLRDIANSGELGQIRYIDCARLNLGLFQQDVNVIWDLAPHDVSIINFILGRPPTAVSAWGHSHANRGLEDVAHIQLRYAETGIRAYIHVSWLDPCKVRRVTIVGSEKMVVYNDLAGDQKIRIFDVGIEDSGDLDPHYGEPVKYRLGDIVSPRVTPQEPLAVQAAHMINCMRTGATPSTDGHSGLAVARVLEAANAALHAGSEVLIDTGPVIDITMDPVPLYAPPLPAAAILDSQATG
jgi:predicted dehydrogenase